MRFIKIRLNLKTHHYTMKIIPTPTNKGFILCDDTAELLDVYYKGMFSHAASTELEGTFIEIEVKNALNTKFSIIKNNVSSGEIHFKWNRHITIQYFDETMQQTNWKVYPKGMIKQRFEIKDEHETLYLIITPSLKWSKMKYIYHIEQECPDISTADLTELLIYCGYVVNLYMLRRAGAG